VSEDDPRLLYTHEDDETGEARRSLQGLSPFTPALSHVNMMVFVGARGSGLQALQNVPANASIPTFAVLAYARYQVREGLQYL
jgi:hypothetical protein